MSKERVFDAFLSRFGMAELALIATICLVGVLALWAIAHFAAASGHQVKVLYGLVEYTKSSKSNAEPQPETGTLSTKVDGDNLQGRTAVRTPILAPGSPASVAEARVSDNGASQRDEISREFVGKSQSIIRIDLEGVTSVERRQIIENQFIGKWMTIEGKIVSILNRNSDRRTASITATSTSGDLAILEVEADAVRQYRVGDAVIAQGRIENIDYDAFYLSQVTLLQDDR